MNVRPKKELGQHFLKNPEICLRIAGELTLHGNYNKVLEIGPGTGALTTFLLERKEFETSVIEIDEESIAYLKVRFPELKSRIIEGDFLRLDLSKLFGEPFAIIGNFPYNISSQIVFRIIDFKDYGIISVLAQAYYDIEYLFSVDEHEFNPPPRVKSGVIRMKRKFGVELGCDENKFKLVVKTAFNQRRKTLRNSLKSIIQPDIDTSAKIFDLRPEQLHVHQFVELTRMLLRH
jgi:16S rRNA (adenine1518-N6/adenine1519-N6)-dimethyltransferase